MDKKEVSGEIPFEFLHEMGHNTRAMDRFFSLSDEERENLMDSVSTSGDPDERAEQALKSLAHGGEGYFEQY
ncbi:hypothetical protein [Agathobaculum sp.]|uniref:hypothetical protein n=1 Tax=Agathobaculum sp. TaxID=2048138 RepID=UPI002A7F2195|nr:hypothetical protein [Agathobaculum sp.]MDY3619397.1 hypothetical protein [Agathobaculum sp.]